MGTEMIPDPRPLVSEGLSFTMAKRSEFSKFMKKQEKKEKALAEKAKQEALENEAPKESVIPNDLGKSTSLVFFRQYNTYQALLEVFPKETLSVNACFSKTILYIMRWFRGRLRESTYEEYPEIAFLKEDYPLPENYADFRIENAGNINGLDFIDLETAYLPEKEAWLVCLTEPDNGNDKKDIQGRTFTTEIMVYKQEKSVVLGVRESCREPKSNTIDATVYRPGFIRDMFFDPDLILGEYGLKKEYAFDIKPILLNGKSGEACDSESCISDNIIEEHLERAYKPLKSVNELKDAVSDRNDKSPDRSESHSVYDYRQCGSRCDGTAHRHLEDRDLGQYECECEYDAAYCDRQDFFLVRSFC